MFIRGKQYVSTKFATVATSMNGAEISGTCRMSANPTCTYLIKLNIIKATHELTYTKVSEDYLYGVTTTPLPTHRKPHKALREWETFVRLAQTDRFCDILVCAAAGI